jgi:hypothetical protein
MIITCIRCGKEIDTPDETNADYITAPDLVAIEVREVIIALRHNQATLEKKAQGLTIEDSEYDREEVGASNIQAVHSDSSVVKMAPVLEAVDVQKSGIICPECHRPGDTVIWGVHKAEEAGSFNKE